ncbi:protein of unknown function [Thermomonospora echinospora]|uniref:DUF397 domain-containing protein n=1 Tax=Thermomonospora echinospora TaxID=1992 RepID=A0A1H5VHP3_9ACTN|nr:DUF397 domain-containing protein [Thermomonospora echinospora]SEF86576.1 protein of unknown function [Thermomonospora echinospora]
MSDATKIEWRKSSYSDAGSGDCVELATLPGVVGIRDSKNPAAGHLQVGRRHLAALFTEVKTGRHDL